MIHDTSSFTNSPASAAAPEKCRVASREEPARGPACGYCRRPWAVSRNLLDRSGAAASTVEQMTIDFAVRRAEPADAPSMARVHVDAWRETYRGLMSDAVLDDPGLPSWRERFWAAALTDQRYGQNIAAIALHKESVIGVAMSGPPLAAAGPQQLYVLYVYAAFHGSGVGTALLNAVIDRTAPAALWVADPNPRAQAFYRKHGFVTDGAVKIEDDVLEIRMIRAIDAADAR